MDGEFALVCEESEALFDLADGPWRKIFDDAVDVDRFSERWADEDDFVEGIVAHWKISTGWHDEIIGLPEHHVRSSARRLWSFCEDAGFEVCIAVGEEMGSLLDDGYEVVDSFLES